MKRTTLADLLDRTIARHEATGGSMKPITIRRLDKEIRELIRDLATEKDQNEAEIILRDIEQMQKQRRVLRERWMPTASTGART